MLNRCLIIAPLLILTVFGTAIAQSEEAANQEYTIFLPMASSETDWIMTSRIHWALSYSQRDEWAMIDFPVSENRIELGIVEIAFYAHDDENEAYFAALGLSRIRFLDEPWDGVMNVTYVHHLPIGVWAYLDEPIEIDGRKTVSLYDYRYIDPDESSYPYLWANGARSPYIALSGEDWDDVIHGRKIRISFPIDGPCPYSGVAWFEFSAQHGPIDQQFVSDCDYASTP